jgi:hypothetical protein
MSYQGGEPSIGTYRVEGDRLILSFKGEEGGQSELSYTMSLGRATLDLYDPRSGKKVVQLVRLFQKPKSSKSSQPRAPQKDLVAGAVEKVDPADDQRLASVEFSPKDGAFKVRYPPGWTVETGSRPDNLYSWARFTQDSAKIQMYADAAGSLMSGSDTARPTEEGSTLAPVHRAHVLYLDTVKKEYSEYNETEPALFKGSRLGEGRISAYNASEGGLFGATVKGYRVTLLTNNRRITLLCQCSPRDFARFKATFMAVCRSVSY